MMEKSLNRELAELTGWIRIEPALYDIGRYLGICPMTGVRKMTPEFDVDPADCMELVKYMVEQGVVIQAWKQIPSNQYCAAVLSGISAQADTLELAIATACRDALRAMKEGAG